MTSATLFPDTTILIQYQSLDRIDWQTLFGVDQVRLMLSASVLQEVQDIIHQDLSPALSARAREALIRLRDLKKGLIEAPASLSIQLTTNPRLDFNVEGLTNSSVADILLASIIRHQQAHALDYVALLTDDKETRQKAEAVGIEVYSLPAIYLHSSIRPSTAAGPGEPEVQPVSHPAAHSAISHSRVNQRLVSPSPLFNPSTYTSPKPNQQLDTSETRDSSQLSRQAPEQPAAKQVVQDEKKDK